MNDLRESLKQEFKDPDIRYAYAESSLNTRIASQIKVLREQRGETQDKIAERCGTKQAGFSRFEDANHSVWKTDTLWKIARALDVRLHISFETFGSLIEDKERFSREYLERPGFEDDPAFKEPAQEPAAATTTPQLAFVPYDLRTRTLAMAMAEDVCALWPGYVESGNVALGTCAENFPNGMTLWGMAGVTHQLTEEHFQIPNGCLYHEIIGVQILKILGTCNSSGLLLLLIGFGMFIVAFAHDYALLAK